MIIEIKGHNTFKIERKKFNKLPERLQLSFCSENQDNWEIMGFHKTEGSVVCSILIKLLKLTDDPKVINSCLNVCQANIWMKTFSEKKGYDLNYK